MFRAGSNSYFELIELQKWQIRGSVGGGVSMTSCEGMALQYIHLFGVVGMGCACVII